MAGTLFSLALSQQCDAQGRPLLDAPLYIYEANTSTPVDVYQDFGLSVLHPWPLRTDSAGRFPAFWVDDGNYRARLTDKAGAVVYFDIANIQAVGPSSGEGEGGGGGSVDQNAIFATGDMLWQPKTGTRSGWVRANARTIGSASSGATERANADTQPLYEFLWNGFSNDLCPVTGGRGGSAASDFAANKAIGLPDMRGRCPVGLDDMGNSAAERVEDGTPTAISYGGQEKPEIAEENLPAHTHGAGSYTAASGGAHTHTVWGDISGNASLGGSGIRMTDLLPSSSGADATGTTSSGGAHTHTVSGTSGSTGSGTPINTMNPYMLGTFYIKL